tara:strand:+ start:140 stop:370 length:231 start_codon:yes stop_codon:yes gene_type:complete
MVTKTLTITEDAYNLLKQQKLEDESFSQEITRIVGGKRTRKLQDLFGIISLQEGESLQQDLLKVRKMNLRLLKKRI